MRSEIPPPPLVPKFGLKRKWLVGLMTSLLVVSYALFFCLITGVFGERVSDYTLWTVIVIGIITTGVIVLTPPNMRA